jgi:hypothetical protein
MGNIKKMMKIFLFILSKFECKNSFFLKKILFREKIGMLKFINRNKTLQWVFFLVLLALSIYIIITKTQIADELGATFLFQFFAYFFLQHEYIGKSIVVVLLISQIVLLQLFFIKRELTSKTSLLPACFYLSILLLTKSLITLSPFFFTTLFFLIIISTDYTASSERIKNNAFWVGSIIAIATFFDQSSIVLLVIAIFTLFINHFSKIKEIGILIFGFLLVYFYFFSYFFITDNLSEWLLTFQQIQVLSIFNQSLLTYPFTLVSIIILGCIYLFFLLKFKILSESKVMAQRKQIVTLNTWALLITAAVFISNSSYPLVLGYLYFPISVYLSLLAQEKSPFYIYELITIITLFALWL